MASKNSQSETIKEAVTAATRAISGNKELEINFGGMGSSLPCLLYTSDAADE